MSKQRVHYLSLASVISAFAVVMLHTNGCFWSFSKEQYWVTANIIESVMYFAVPVFFMITGATLIDYRDRYTSKEYAWKRIQKTLIPFIIWSFIGIIYLVLKGSWVIEWNIGGVKNAFIKIINIDVISIYWFFGAIFSIYLSIPLFASVQKEMRMKIFTYIVISVFVLNCMVPFICQIFDISYAANKVTVSVGGGYIIFILLGYILSKKELSPRARYLVYALAIFGLLLHILGTYYLSFEAGQIIQTYKGYFNVPCILYSVGIFVFIKQIGEKIKNEKVISIIERLSSYTFAVYLLHWFIMDIMVRELGINTHSIVYRIGAPSIIFLICIGITWLIRKIPVVRKILP